jgi:hypothetical protein
MDIEDRVPDQNIASSSMGIWGMWGQTCDIAILGWQAAVVGLFFVCLAPSFTAGLGGEFGGRFLA